MDEQGLSDKIIDGLADIVQGGFKTGRTTEVRHAVRRALRIAFPVMEAAARLSAAPAAPKIDPTWSLHDRIEFALRDAGFDYDEASRVAMAATAAPAPVAGDAVRAALTKLCDVAQDVHQIINPQPEAQKLADAVTECVRAFRAESALAQDRAPKEPGRFVTWKGDDVIPCGLIETAEAIKAKQHQLYLDERRIENKAADLYRAHCSNLLGAVGAERCDRWQDLPEHIKRSWIAKADEVLAAEGNANG